ncbi:maleylpyruvate isomerase family mycothiol-dependent enzyme [Aquipuribacter sp. SD81]|uniref:maleylpyruvate isomerase family mycothiol-dependent enzyme n=1 Tax=Aquipuribacter sp. SD81 TaxID=3127703 RepID=UPI003017D9C4
MAGAARHDPGTTLRWAREGTGRLLGLVDGLDDEAARAPSLLPGWTRAHVVAHVARNAEALGRLAHWARTGDETPMYASPEARDADIARTAAAPAPALAADVRDSAAALDRALVGVGEDGAWDAEVRGRRGARVRAALLPWLRTREVWLHAADLGLGDPADALADAPPGLLEELLSDVAATLSREAGCPNVVLAATDAEVTARLGAEPGPTVRGTRAELVLWLAGRDAGRSRLATDDGDLPTLPRWL